MSEEFSLFTEEQRLAYCGACSLAYGLYMAGIDTDQDEVARKIGRRGGGYDEHELKRAANKYGVRSEFLLVDDKGKGHSFAERLRKHLQSGRPAVLLNNHFGAFKHWIAALGYVEDKQQFILIDPNDHDPIFCRWSERTLIQNSWNEDDAPCEKCHGDRTIPCPTCDGNDPGCRRCDRNGEVRCPDCKGTGIDASEPDQYFALLLDCPTRWRMTEDFVRLCEAGSADTLESMTSDILEVGILSTPGEKLSTKGRPFAEILDENEDVVVEYSWKWTGVENEITKADVREQYRDYRIVADAAGLRLPDGADPTHLVAQMTALMCAFIWSDGDL
ncbi:MAG: C39 family peptidase [Deltaproteobacteria bacterium]|nr:C39 family peptidase [Deltaproteobacteria bacterium]